MTDETPETPMPQLGEPYSYICRIFMLPCGRGAMQILRDELIALDPKARTTSVVATYYPGDPPVVIHKLGVPIRAFQTKTDLHLLVLQAMTVLWKIIDLVSPKAPAEAPLLLLQAPTLVLQPGFLEGCLQMECGLAGVSVKDWEEATADVLKARQADRRE